MSGLGLEEQLLLLGLSHHTAPVSLRERLAFRAEDMQRALGSVLARGFSEAAILSTCNRVEVLALSKAGPASVPAGTFAATGRDAGATCAADSAGRIRGFLSEFHGVPESAFAPSLYQIEGWEAARHLFEVTGSLDSQILGETEILAQSKEAFRVSAECGACGPVLHKIFERAFFLSKELRGDGGISRTQASVSSAAVALAQKVFEVKGRKVLVVGTGEMATGIVRALRAAGVSEIWVASRTEERAAEFAHREGGKPCQMQHLPEHLAQVDIVLVSAAAPHYIISPEHIRAATARRRGRNLCLIDISVPRNVDPAVEELEDAFLFDIDDLEEVARDGRREREAVAARWRPRLAEEARELLRALQDSGSRDTARKLIEHAAALRAEVLRQAHTAGLDPKALEELARALERLQGRMLHGPLETLKQAAREGDGADAAAWVTRLFRLELEQAQDKPGAAGPASVPVDKPRASGGGGTDVPARRESASPAGGDARPAMPLLTDMPEARPGQA